MYLISRKTLQEISSASRKWQRKVSMCWLWDNCWLSMWCGKKKKLKKLGCGKPVFKALGNSLCFKSPLFILSQSLGRKKAWLQTQNQTAGSYTEHGSQVLLDQYFQSPSRIPLEEILWIRSLHKQMLDRFLWQMRCRSLRVMGSWNNLCQGSQEKGRYLHWKRGPSSAAVRARLRMQVEIFIFPGYICHCWNYCCLPVVGRKLWARFCRLVSWSLLTD